MAAKIDSKPAPTMDVGRLEVRQAPAVLIVKLVSLALIMLLVLVLFGFIKESVNSFFGQSVYNVVSSDFFLLLVGFLIYASISLYLILQWKSIVYVIYPGKIIFMSGVIVKKQRIIEMNMYKSAEYRRDVMGRIFGYGTLSLDYLGTGLKFDTLHNIPDPEYYLDCITRLIGRTT